MSWRDCVECGDEFEIEPGKEWARTCFDCWRQSKIDEGTWRGSTGRARSGFLGGPGVSRDSISDEFYELLPLLLTLCHPDKHNGDAANARATRITKWLLEKRDLNK